MSISRDYRAEDERRNELARKRGFRSRAQERNAPRRISNMADLELLPLPAREERARSLKAVSIMRENPGMDLADAAFRAGTTPESVRWHVGEALDRRGSEWVATGGDRLYRPMIVYSGGAVVPIDVRGSRKASEVSAYHAAVRHYLDTGDEDPLRHFVGKTVAGVEYETDPNFLDEMARRRQLDVESIYQLVA